MLYNVTIDSEEYWRRLFLPAIYWKTLKVRAILVVALIIIYLSIVYFVLIPRAVAYAERWEDQLTGPRSPWGSGAQVWGLFLPFAFMLLYYAFQELLKSKYLRRFFGKLWRLNCEGRHPMMIFAEDDILQKYFVMCINCSGTYVRKSIRPNYRFCKFCGEALYPSVWVHKSSSATGRIRKR
jgi:hypothetical protein